MLGASSVVVWRLSAHGSPPAALPMASAAAPSRLPASPLASASAPGSAMGLSSTSPSPAPASPSPSAAASQSGALIAADDFSGTAPDTGKWGLYDSTAPNGSLWSPSAVRVTGGELQIVGTGKNATGKGNVAGGLCWCGANGNRLYGIWQVRARFDAGAGYGPIIGLWPKSDSGTDGYISAVNMPGADRNSLSGRVLWAGSGHDSGTASADFTRWHTFTIEWRATFVKLSVDGKLYYDSTRSTANPVIPQTPLHLYIQVTVGPADGTPAPDASTPAHVVTHIDWVRMYR